jgi:hypothetical protein
MKALFFGGCLLTTKTVAKDKRFINVLLSRNAELKIDLARYASFSLVEEIFLSHLSIEFPDSVVFLIRPFPFCILTKLLPRIPKIGGGVEVKVHPGLFSKEKTEWFLENDKLIVEMDWNPNGTKRSLTHSMNLFLGRIFGLDKWAINYVKQKLLLLHQLCIQKNIRFIVMGPPAVSNDKQERKLLINLNRELMSCFEKEKINYVNLFSADFPESLLGPDKVHYSDNGHFQLAKKIEEKIITPPFAEVQK